MQLTLAAIAKVLGGDLHGDYVLAPGPGHSAEDRSLSVRLSEDAADGFTVKSFSTDDWKACKDHVRDKLRLERAPNGHAKTNDKGAGNIVDEYIYRTADGEPYLRVQRTRTKAFLQAHWTGTAWANGKPKGDPIPYKLPQLLAADPGDVVFIVEGEKDVGTMTKCGFVATTAPQGAQTPWPACFAPHFKGRRVCILPDNDDAGRAHAQDVATKLTGVAADIRVVALPGLPPKGDVSDWLDDSDAKRADLFSLYDAAAAAEIKPPLDATPFVWIDPSTLPQLDWIYDRSLIRGFVSLTVAPGGVGKSTIIIGEHVAMASGRMVLHAMPRGVHRVWYWNGEEPPDLLTKRVAATMKRNGIAAAELGGRLFVDSGLQKPLVIARQTREGVTIAEPAVDAVIATIQRHGIDVFTVDPFVSCHEVSENDNGAIDRVVKKWAHIAHVTRCAIHLVHHSRKTGGEAVNIEDSRGGGALIAGVRSSRTINFMSEEEAAKAGVTERFSYVRLDDGKVNLAPRCADAKWLKLVGEPLGNGPGGTDGDSIGVAARWTWPDPADDIDPDNLDDILSAVRNGRWREDIQAKDWVGIPIAEILGLDVSAGSKADPATKPARVAARTKVAGLVQHLVRKGTLKVVTGLTEQRKEKNFVEVGQ